MIYPVLITVDHDGKKIKPGGTVDLTSEQAAPLIRGGFIGSKVLNATAQEEPENTGTGTEPTNGPTNEPASELDRVIEAIGKIDPAKTELFTGSGKPKTEVFEGVEGIDFTVSAALRDDAVDGGQPQPGALRRESARRGAHLRELFEQLRQILLRHILRDIRGKGR